MIRFLLLSLLFPLNRTANALQPKSTEHRYRCGQRPINSIGVITAGQTTWPGQFPWHAALYRLQQLGSDYICGGFLVSDRVTVTAAHCVTAPNGYQMVPEALSVRLGVYELLAMTRNGQEHRVERIYRHGEYRSDSYRHDVAILQTVVEFTQFVQPICLWSVEEHGEGNGLVGTVSGWGLTEYDVLANSLKSARLPMVSYLECLVKDRDLFAQVVFDGMFCAGLDNGTNVCNGDSGGAFVVNINGTWIARGIISFTGLRESTVTLCNPRSYAGFVNLPRYVEWIEKVANSDRFVPIESSSNDGNVTKKDYPTSEPISSTQRINARKCAQYRNRSSSGGMTQDLSYLAFVARETPFMRVIDCFAVLISEHFLISTADCRRFLPGMNRSDGQQQFVIIETEGHTLRYGVENFHQHPEFIPSPTENNLALIELARNVSIPISQLQIVCLWNQEELDSAKIILYSAMDVTKRSPLMESVKCFDQLLAPSIVVPVEGFYHLAGLVVNSTCSRIRFIKLYKFIPWIEGIVWENEVERTEIN